MLTDLKQSLHLWVVVLYVSRSRDTFVGSFVQVVEGSVACPPGSRGDGDGERRLLRFRDDVVWCWSLLGEGSEGGRCWLMVVR
jgi:hypothetical protein